jgi:hypothetical protein
MIKESPMWTATETTASDRRQALLAAAAAHRRLQQLNGARRHHRAHGEPLPRLVWLRRWVLAP